MLPGITFKAGHTPNNHAALGKKPGKLTINSMGKLHPSVFNKELEKKGLKRRKRKRTRKEKEEKGREGKGEAENLISANNWRINRVHKLRNKQYRQNLLLVTNNL